MTDQPQYAGNRFIVIGDFNLSSPSCGEHYSLLRRLREEFGYALDVTMAVDGSAAMQLGQHDVGAGTTNLASLITGFASLFPDGIPLALLPRQVRLFAASYVDQSFGREVRGWTDPLNPEGERHVGHNDDVHPAPDGYPHYPWWSRTFRGKTGANDGGSSRLNTIILVGKGWAYDDPVQVYRLMWDNHLTIAAMGATPNPASCTSVADCVEQWDGTSGSCADGSAASYRPRFELSSRGLRAGAAALHSDHRPVGVRLRVWKR